MGPEGATDIVYRREIQAAADPAARRTELIDEYKERFANPWVAAERGYIDDVIDPAETRMQTDRRSQHAPVEAGRPAAAQARKRATVSEARSVASGSEASSVASGSEASSVASGSVAVIGPDPTDEEAAAIVAAVEMAWPRAAPAPVPSDQGSPRWRFSGRWWAQPTVTSRRRP